MYSAVSQLADDESINPIISVQGQLQRRSTNEEIENRKFRLSSEAAERRSFVAAPRDGLTSSQAADLLKKWGRNELEDKKIPKVDFNISIIFILIFLILKIYNSG